MLIPNNRLLNNVLIFIHSIKEIIIPLLTAFPKGLYLVFFKYKYQPNFTFSNNSNRSSISAFAYLILFDNPFTSKAILNPSKIEKANLE